MPLLTRIPSSSPTCEPVGFGAFRNPDQFVESFADQTLQIADHLGDRHRYPHEVTILAIGPLTNVALAMRLDPTIVPLIKQIVIMGGQIYAPGNAFNDAGEFNWWMDPEAAQVVLRANVSRLIIPLDVTNTVTLPQRVYDQIVNRTRPTIVTQLYKEVGPGPGDFIYDSVAFASFYDPSLGTDTKDLYVDMPTTFDVTYGMSKVYPSNPYPSIPALSPSKVVFQIDNDRFFRLYTDLLTRAVPVQFGHQPEGDKEGAPGVRFDTSFTN